MPLPSSMSLTHSSNFPGVGMLEMEYDRIMRGAAAGWGILIVTNWPALCSKFGSSVSKCNSKTSSSSFMCFVSVAFFVFIGWYFICIFGVWKVLTDLSVWV